MTAQDNMAGTQFHPEKSQALCLKAYRPIPEVTVLGGCWAGSPAQFWSAKGHQRICRRGKPCIA